MDRSIVVDHHKCASELPVALALVNPNRLDEDEGRQHGHLAAVGVAWLLGAALVRVLRGRGFFANRAEPKLLDLLDIVALGTVADVAALKGLNRAFVAQGLKVMAQRRNTGMNALIDLDGLALGKALFVALYGFEDGLVLGEGDAEVGREGRIGVGIGREVLDVQPVVDGGVPIDRRRPAATRRARVAASRHA